MPTKNDETTVIRPRSHIRNLRPGIKNPIPIKPRRLTRAFYERPTLQVARELLGKFLVHETADGKLVGMIVETEAYVGPRDLACHASKGRTKRTEVMFGPAGHIYIYLIYGMYHCLNIVTGPVGFPAAVLLRALQPVERRGEFSFETDGRASRPDGPGKLCRFMEISLAHYGADLCAGSIWIEDSGQIRNSREIAKSARIGIDYAGIWKDNPWRFYLKNNPWVSRS